jgi:molecular chaperone GrpE
MRSSPGTDDTPATEERPADDLRAELAASEDRYLRARADLENYRKRADRELERRVTEQTDAALRAWLEVVDSLERALALEAGRHEVAEGLRAVLDQMQAILARQGVTALGGIGERFDPELHEAVAAVPDADREPGTIAEVARSGYSIGDRVVRPAQVAVTRRPDGAG